MSPPFQLTILPPSSTSLSVFCSNLSPQSCTEKTSLMPVLSIRESRKGVTDLSGWRKNQDIQWWWIKLRKFNLSRNFTVSIAHVKQQLLVDVHTASTGIHVLAFLSTFLSVIYWLHPLAMLKYFTLKLSVLMRVCTPKSYRYQ